MKTQAASNVNIKNPSAINLIYETNDFEYMIPKYMNNEIAKVKAKVYTNLRLIPQYMNRFLYEALRVSLETFSLSSLRLPHWRLVVLRRLSVT